MTKYRHLLIFILLLSSTIVRAAEETRSASLRGSQIAASTTGILDLQDDKYTCTVTPASCTGLPSFVNTGVENFITLRWTGANRTFYTAVQTIEVIGTLERWSQTGVQQTTPTLENITLVITIDPANGVIHTDQAMYRSTNPGYRSRFTVTSAKINNVVATLPSDILLESAIKTTRYYTYDQYTAPPMGYTYDANKQTLNVYWNYVAGAVEYDLEWYFVNALNPTAAANPDMKQATRVTVSEQNYTINTVFDQGNVFLRVRAVFRGGTQNNERRESIWTTNQNAAIQGIDPYRNWTYSIAYAEDGKHKEVVSYFDGSGRNRQSVTQVNSDNISLIGEQFYDYEGRGALQTLPAPSIVFDNSLRFYTNFTLNSAGTLFSKANFDNDILYNSSTCSATTAPTMKNTGGASQYYSPNNTRAQAGDAFNVALPDAKEYPYVMTVFSGDGRVQEQTAPGPAHALASGHTTRMFYGRPMQDRLDRLFGTEAGYAEHYSVEYVQDANGQMSVVYKDLAGRVVATALTGPKPGALDGITSYVTSPTTIRESFDELNRYDPQIEGMVTQTDYLVEVGGETHTFHYEITPAQYAALCGLDGDGVAAGQQAFACKYKLLITIYDACNNPIDDNQAPHIVHTSYANINPANLVYDFTVTFPNIGMYRIEKKLVLDPTALSGYQTSVQSQLPGTCGKTLAGFQADYAATVDQSECTGLAACSTYCVTEADRLGLTGTPRTTFITNCQTGCKESLPDISNCDVLLDKIKDDFSPGGQYLSNSTWPTLYLWADNTGPWSTMGFQDASGNPINTWAGLIANWQPGWETRTFPSSVSALPSYGSRTGTQLIAFHPEYCQYNWCTQTTTSRQYDLQLLMATTFTQATAAPFNFSKTNNGLGILNADPYFTAGGQGVSQYSLMNSDLPTIFTNAVNYLNTIGCPPPTSSYSATCNDELWIAFRRFYLKRKAELMDLRNAAVNNGCSRFCDATTPPDAIADANISGGCTSNPAWIIGFKLLVPDLQTPLNTIATASDPPTSAMNYANSLTTATSPCKTPATGTFTIATFSSSATYSVVVKANGTTISNVVSGNFSSITQLKVAIIAAVNSFIGNPDFVASDAGGNNFTISAPAALGTAGNGYAISLTVTNGTTTISRVVAGCATSSTNFQLCGGGTSACPDFPDCFCTELEALVSQYNLMTATEKAQYASMNAYIAQVLTEQTRDPITGLTITPAITAAQVNTWRTNCTSHGIPEGAPGMTQTPVPAGIDCDQNNAPCTDDASLIANWSAQQAYIQQNAQLLEQFTDGYTSACFATPFKETFWVEHKDREHHYTLYYYDQAGNLTRTVPPAGVVRLDLNAIATGTVTVRQQIQQGRANHTNNRVPLHTMVTRYKYDSYNQLVWQSTPDGGVSNFWYDKLGRIRVSQNAKQAAASTGGIFVYSYTTYDALGRIVEVGQVTSFTAITQATLDNETNYNAWVVAGVREQVTKTYYDAPMASNPVAARFPGGQTYLRKRIASVTVEESFDGNDLTYSYASHYSYDVHGNVSTLIQETPDLARLDNTATNHYQRYKIVQYEYDLISGNVNEVEYQRGQNDEFRHRYYYDADNRITNVYTSRNGYTWDQDAKYLYYLHGPMARTEIGDRKVQGLDYMYTIQGWIKGVNAAVLDRTKDIGNDGSTLAYEANMQNQHGMIGADAYGYMLQYFSNYTKSAITYNDYLAVNSAGTAALGDFVNTNSDETARDLYNGNIKAMGVALSTTTSSAMPLMKNNYRYDQLNRLVEHKAWTSGSVTDLYFNLTQATNLLQSQYYNTFTYDANGNILSQKRNGTTSPGVSMDNLTYIYQGGSNKLTQVTDLPNTAADRNRYEDDIDNQNANNYSYDEIGNLKSDASEGIASITWNVYGKIKTITRLPNFSKIVNSQVTYPPDLEFQYDAMGQRILKIVKKRNASGLLPQKDWLYTYYVRDAQGNILTTYTRSIIPDPGNASNTIDEYKVSEWSMYGSSRLGTQGSLSTVVTAAKLTFVTATNAVVSRTATALATTLFERKAGEKLYELVNHLGNVLNTVTDRILPRRNVGNTTSIADYYVADVMSATDYAAFGAPLVGRQYTAPATNYRYGFNGMEKDAEMHGNDGDSYDFGARMLDVRLGRWLSIDPQSTKYPFASPYNYTLNNPILFIDPDGEDVTIKDAASLKAMLGGLTSDEIKRIKIKKDGQIKIRGKRQGSRNLENLRTLVKSEVNHNVITGTTYASASGNTELPETSSGRTLFPASETPPGRRMEGTTISPDDDVYIIIRPTTESGAVEVFAHEAYGHAVLGELRRQGENVSAEHQPVLVTKPNPNYDPNDPSKGGPTIIVREEGNNDFKTQAYPAVGESRKNYKNNSTNDKWKKRLERKVKRLERKLK